MNFDGNFKNVTFHRRTDTIKFVMNLFYMKSLFAGSYFLMILFLNS